MRRLAQCGHCGRRVLVWMGREGVSEMRPVRCACGRQFYRGSLATGDLVMSRPATNNEPQ